MQSSYTCEIYYERGRSEAVPGTALFLTSKKKNRWSLLLLETSFKFSCTCILQFKKKGTEHYITTVSLFQLVKTQFSTTILTT